MRRAGADLPATDCRGQGAQIQGQWVLGSRRFAHSEAPKSKSSNCRTRTPERALDACDSRGFLPQAAKMVVASESASPLKQLAVISTLALKRQRLSRPGCD